MFRQVAVVLAVTAALELLTFASLDSAHAASDQESDWYGRFEIEQKGVALPPTTGESTHSLWADLSLDFDASGNLRGRAVGSATFKSHSFFPGRAHGFGCDVEETDETVQPAKIQGGLVGAYTPGHFNLASEEQSTPIMTQWRLTRVCRDGTSREGGMRNWGSDEFLEIIAGILRDALSPTADGGYEWSHTQSEDRGGYTRMRLWLRSNLVPRAED